MIHMDVRNLMRIAVLAVFAIVSTTCAPVQTTSQAQVSYIIYHVINIYTAILYQTNCGLKIEINQ